ncbi:MAG: acyl CoA--acetate/3-ketoacid CoA transferase subunit beta [Clostridiales bacterium]|nr:acyl CoA--acetate/3-ketoacid CoA transferase subunit beta [Clostridiales bacterium]MCF8023135.1 acyl CoA--acetate/3-ketoacid CoA transferase subunit beta [Clostridiales bacterium]
MLQWKENYEIAKPEDYKTIDLLAVAGAREVSDMEVVFAGTGLPMLAVTMAQHTGAPGASIIYEAGSMDGRPAHLPASVGDARCEHKASVASGLFDVFNQLQKGSMDMAFLGGAEIDRYGNVNTTAIGDYLNPTMRLAGSGGNSDINSLCPRTVFIMVQEKRRFKENVDYITSPGWRVKDWPSGKWVSRQKAYGSMYRGGPSAVITNMAVFRFDENGIMYLDTFHPGADIEKVKENVGFDLNTAWCRGETAPPTYHELYLLYNVIDPEGIFIA